MQKKYLLFLLFFSQSQADVTDYVNKYCFANIAGIQWPALLLNRTYSPFVIKASMFVAAGSFLSWMGNLCYSGYVLRKSSSASRSTTQMQHAAMTDKDVQTIVNLRFNNMWDSVNAFIHNKFGTLPITIKNLAAQVTIQNSELDNIKSKLCTLQVENKDLKNQNEVQIAALQTLSRKLEIQNNEINNIRSEQGIYQSNIENNNRDHAIRIIKLENFFEQLKYLPNLVVAHSDRLAQINTIIVALQQNYVTETQNTHEQHTAHILSRIEMMVNTAHTKLVSNIDNVTALIVDPGLYREFTAFKLYTLEQQSRQQSTNADNTDAQ